MPTIQIRPALESDQEIIRQMVKNAQLDPTSLHWSHFKVAEQDGLIIGIGQIRPYPRCRELGSLTVTADYRKHGVGAMIVNALLEQETGDIYLECESFNERYYTRFGFVRIPWYQAPYPLNLKVSLIGGILRIVFREHIIAMKRTPPAS
jgi:N-acetylglutamate synthase-like GNAT family acetyltransferase